MISAFNNYKVGTRILIGYVIALMLMAAVIIVAILRFQQINETVTTLAEGLAAEQHLADRVVASVWATHFYALQYMDQQNPVDLGRYRSEYANFDQILDVADGYITEQNRLAHLDNIRNGIQAYRDDFARVINLLVARNQELLLDLDQQGRLAELKLEQIRANSFFADDAATSYQAGNAQRALLLMRVAAFQYLASGDNYWLDEFDRAYESAQISFEKLDEATQSRVYRELASDAEVAVATYVDSFSEIQDNYLQQQEIVTTRLNVLGPFIRDEGAAIAADVAVDFQATAATTQTLANRTQWLLSLTMGVAILAALASGLVITRSITDPLEKVTEVARQIADLDLRKLTSEMDAIAQGDLARDLTITTRALSIRSGDEIGQMSRAFNAVIRQLQRTGIAFGEMITNLRILTERNTRLVELAETARQNAEDASQAKSNFLANMSHELRTPLNAILGHAQILGLDRNLPPSHLDSLSVIRESGRHLLTLINDILDLAKIEAGKLTLQPDSVHFPAFLEGVARMMQLRAREKGLLFEYKLGPNLPSGVEVDEKRLRQVLINLLSNAIKFTPNGTVRLQAYAIEMPRESGHGINAHKITQQIRILVTDTGIGIQPDQVDVIFEPFEQLAADSLAIEGTGLGLPISQRLIEAMGSRIQLDSREGEGSIFWFDLALPVTEFETPAKSPEVSRPVGYSGTRRRILVVDDERNNLSLLADFLRILGFETVTIQSRQEAIKQALQYHPDLILIALDSLLSGQSDAARIEEIRRHGNAGEAIVVGVSVAHSQHQTTDCDCDDYLPAPIDFDRLTELLERHLQLTWVFEDDLSPSERKATAADSYQSYVLTSPSMEELNSLYDLAMKGNMPGIYKKAAEIGQSSHEYKPFIDLVQKLAKDYDEENILILLESIRNQESF